MTRPVHGDDPRLHGPVCHSLQPVVTEHENAWFAVRNRKGFFTIEYNRPQTLILPIVDNNAILLARVKRPVIDDATWEVPAGGVGETETFVEAARRELTEETGIHIADLQRFFMIPPFALTPRYPCFPSIFQVHLSGLEFQNRKPHDDEIEEVEMFPFPMILKMILHGEIYIGLQVAILTRFLLENQFLVPRN